MVEFDDEGYPPGSFGYQIRLLKAEIRQLTGPVKVRLEAKVDQLEAMVHHRRDKALRDAGVLPHPGEESLPPGSEG